MITKYLLRGTVILLSTLPLVARAADVNVSGLTMGMSPDQVRRALPAGYKELPHPGKNDHLSLFAEAKGSNDVFYFTFFDNRLVALVHDVKFSAGAEPQYDQTVSDLKGKFGQPIHVFYQGVQFAFRFD